MSNHETREPERRRYRSLPSATQRPAVAGVVVSFLVNLSLGVRFAGETQPRWLDQWALALVGDSFPGRAAPARSVIGLADPLPLTVLTIVLCGACLVAGRRSLALLAVVGPLMTVLVTMALKPLIDRTKDGDLAYPSGHAGAATALALVAGLLLVSFVNVEPWVAVVVVAAVTVTVGAGMGLAMTVANYHYATDVVGGFCTAVSVVLVLALLLDRGLGRAGPGPPF